MSLRLSFTWTPPVQHRIFLVVPAMRQLALLGLLVSSLGFSAGSQTEEKSGKKHTSDERINEKIDRYLELLQTKKKAIEKFLTDNYSDFNHSDYTPEVRPDSFPWWVLIFCVCRSTSVTPSMPTC